MSTFSDRLAALEEQTRMLSSTQAMRETAAFAAIKAMGEEAVPDLLAALNDSRTPLAIMLLLNEITGAQPVDRADRGDIAKMIAAWIAWGKTRG